jgi:hypothetical protein
VKDHNGQALAFIYFEDEPGRRTAATLLKRDEARRIAVNMARLPELLSAEPKPTASKQRLAPPGLNTKQNQLWRGHILSERLRPKWAKYRIRTALLAASLIGFLHLQGSHCRRAARRHA